MSKQELLDYIDYLLNDLKSSMNNIQVGNDDNLIFIKQVLEESLKDVLNLVYLNLEKMDNYLNLPYDLLNILAFYQSILKSKTFSLTEEQKQYALYSIREILMVINRIIEEKGLNCKDYVDKSKEIECINGVKDILVDKEEIDLDDFSNIVKMLNNIHTSYANELLGNISSYMQSVLIHQEALKGSK